VRLPTLSANRTHRVSPPLPDCAFPCVVQFTNCFCLPALAAVLTKADPAVLTSMINAAFRLTYSISAVRPLPSWAPTQLSSTFTRRSSAEIAFREQAHAIARCSALASANVDPVAAAVGILYRTKAPARPHLWWRTSSLGPLRRSCYASDTLRRILVTERHSLEMRRMSYIHSQYRD
jgi:hypothetical protein